MKKAFSRILLTDFTGRFIILEDHSGHMNFPGGKQEPGENARACAIREVYEEIGITVEAVTELEHGTVTFGTTDWHYTFYLGNVARGKEAVCEPDKIKAVHYADDLQSIAFPTELSPIFSRIFSLNALRDFKTEWMSVAGR